MSRTPSFITYASRLSQIMYSILPLALWFILGLIIYLLVSKILASQARAGWR